MALWGNNDSVGSAGTVSLNYGTGVVTGTDTLFGETGSAQEGDVISFGLREKTGVYFGDAVIISIASTESLTIGSTAGLSGVAIAGTDFTISQAPKYTVLDSSFSEAEAQNHGYSKIVYGVGSTSVGHAEGGVYATGAGWVGVTTYTDTSGNLRVKKEILVAMSGIATGNAPVYPDIASAN